MKIVYLGNRLSKHGLTPTGVEYLGSVLEKGGFSMILSSDKKNILLRLLDMLITLYRNRSADLILIDTYSSLAFYFAFFCGVSAHLLKIPYVLILRGGDMPARVKKTPKLVKGLFLKAAHVVSVSKYLESELYDFHKTVYIPNTIDVSVYNFKPRESVRPRLLWVRSLHQVYNPSLAIKIVKVLSAQFDDVQLAMVGPDKDGSREDLENLIKSEGLSNRIILTGKLSKENWSKLSEEYDIFINTTNFDNMPISVIEAMALGLPVVSSNVGGMPFLIDDMKNGLLVSPNDAVIFSAAITKLITDKSLASLLASKARLMVEAFDNKVVLEQWKHLIYDTVQ